MAFLIQQDKLKNLTDRQNHDQYLAMQAEEERNRVLGQIEEMERSDSNYQRPLWVPEDARSRRSLFNNPPSEHEQFPSDDAFNSALQRRFPRPRDDG